jgi:hypothetical protein
MKTRREKRGKNRNISDYLDKKYLISILRKYREIIIALILGLIVGVFILPKLFR